MPIRWGKGIKSLKTQNPADAGDENQSMKLPSLAAASQDAAAAANEGNIYYDETGNIPTFSDGSNWIPLLTSSTNMGFKTIVPTAGANVVADAAADTLTFKSADASVVVTGTAATDEIDLAVGATLANANLAADAAIAFSKLAALDSANILVGSATNVATKRAVTGVIAISNTGVTSFSHSGCPRRPVVDTAAGVLTLAGQTVDTINTISTNAAADCIVTLDAGTTVGYELTFSFVTDGGFDVVVNTAGADVFHHGAAINSVKATMADAGDYLIVRKVLPDVFVVVAERGVTWA